MNIIEPTYMRKPFEHKEAKFKYSDDSYLDCCEGLRHYHRAIGVHEDTGDGWVLVYHCEGLIWHCWWRKDLSC